MFLVLREPAASHSHSSNSCSDFFLLLQVQVQVQCAQPILDPSIASCY